MTLEVLFAQQGQAETFLRMVLLGAAFALALTLGGCLLYTSPSPRDS